MKSSHRKTNTCCVIGKHEMSRKHAAFYFSCGKEQRVTEKCSMYWPILKGLTTRGNQALSRPAFLTTMLACFFLQPECLDNCIQPKVCKVHEGRKGEGEREIERGRLLREREREKERGGGGKFSAWASTGFLGYQLLVSLSYAKQQLQNLAVIKPGTI